MGWTFLQREVRGKEAISAFFSYEFDFVKDNRKGEVLICEIVDSVAYLAFKRTEGEEVNVSAIVCLIDTTHLGEFGYKDMDESMGPYYYGAPSSILDVLTPTKWESGKEWREECRKQNKEKGD